MNRVIRNEDKCTAEQKAEYKRQRRLKDTETRRAQALCEELLMTKEDKNVQKIRK